VLIGCTPSLLSLLLSSPCFRSHGSAHGVSSSSCLQGHLHDTLHYFAHSYTCMNMCVCEELARTHTHTQVESRFVGLLQELFIQQQLLPLHRSLLPMPLRSISLLLTPCYLHMSCLDLTIVLLQTKLLTSSHFRDQCRTSSTKLCWSSSKHQTHLVAAEVSQLADQVLKVAC